MDPLSAASADEMLNICETSAAGVAEQLEGWNAAEPVIESALDAGLGVLGDVTRADLEAVTAWRPPRRGNGVYLDTTTVVTATRLLSGERTWLTPLTLWDLATVAERVVLADRVYYTGEHLVPAAELNGLLGDDVFVSVPPLAGQHDDPLSAVYSRNLAQFRDLIEPLVHRRPLPDGTYWADAVKQVTDAWSLVTGRPVPPEQALVPREAHGWFTPKVEVVPDPYLDDLPMASDRSGQPVLGDITYRAYASQTFANLLGVPYAPATARMPFRHHFCRRNWELDDRLRTGEAATEAYRQLAKDTDLVLPVFLAVALADAGQLDQIWPRLAELREKARGFRKHRVELDESLALGEVSDTSRQLLMAVRSEAFKLTELLGFGYKLIVNVASRIVRATPLQLPDDVATLEGIARSTLPADLRQRLWWSVFKPDLRFLTHIRTQSRHMTDAMPRIGRLWGLPPSHGELFRTRFEQLAALRIVA
jgi:hypothetical protein